jgi:hypothetical protein
MDDQPDIIDLTDDIEDTPNNWKEVIDLLCESDDEIVSV